MRKLVSFSGSKLWEYCSYHLLRFPHY